MDVLSEHEARVCTRGYEMCSGLTDVALVHELFREHCVRRLLWVTSSISLCDLMMTSYSDSTA